ncbi:signal peptide peptidase SppA [Bacteroides sp. 51]|uniref:signal peptide peptidase SppA n=1 Tax=Bacteroides sp. 51 TaxID=2302938 RepID=UPI0013D1A933|nr:signal peptide peptidase SppA [Bacteroides sp. 51]NDV84442.1 signal peptide peptidase SppA [Bacteroides sp. 51]
MKDFLKFTGATVVGIVLSSVVMFLISIMVLVGMLSSADTETIVKKNSVMMLDLNGTLSERSQENPWDKLLGSDNTVYGLDDILASIKKAKEHDDIKGIYIQASSLGASFASLQEIREALADFKESGKFVYAYGDSYAQGLYYLSSVADKVMLNPKGAVEWKGLAAQPMFFKGLLEKIGVEMQIFKVGTYKSAVEPFINTEMSPENREQMKEYVNSVWNSVVSEVSASRKLSAESLNELADQMLLFSPAEKSVEAGLVDTLIYHNDIRDYIKTQIGIDEDKNLSVLDLKDMINVKKNVPKDKSGNIVAVYYAFGSITSSEASMSDGEGIASDKVIKDLRKLQKDENVKAVVLRVNSGGGSAYASEQIWYAVEELKKEKPVVVSMGDYAASGGYYISCGADWIVADPTTLTGSIGIFGMIPNVEGLTNKLGLNFDIVKTNKFSDLGVIGRAMNNDEKALIQMSINEGYDLFITRCAEGRNMTKEAIDKVGQGRVWTGEKALELGLIDELGGIDRALEVAIERANIEGYTVVSYPEKENILTSILNDKPTNYIETKLLKNNLGNYYKEFNLLKNLENADYMQARVPFSLNME